MTKYFFENQDAEYCYTQEHFIDLMKENQVNEMEVFEAVPDKAPGVFWCKTIGEVGDKDSESCGSVCTDYTPRNGKNGCCRHYTTRIFRHGDPTIIKSKNP